MKEQFMTKFVRTLPLGAATVTIINQGDLRLSLAESLNVPESEWRPRYASDFERPLLFPSQSIHIALPKASVLVDANNYARSVTPASPFLPPNYQPPPDLITQLLEQNIHPEDITHLIITHAHFDHYAGITFEHDGHYFPSFPNAHCYLGLADWEDPETQKALQDPNSDDSRTFGVLHQHGLLELVKGNQDLLPEVRIIAAPGESSGHQIVRLHVDGMTLYCLGDLYHHAVEVEHPTWMAEWANPETNLASRLALTEAALVEDALLIPAHMPVGRLEHTDSGVRWIEV
jgi:glyoxylase-like metal-dependent hydrolase (beta-lactamase superfamily II)